jgi:RNA ligase (TIGR02306 family)
MSFKTCFTKILAVNPHPDTETTGLDIATVYGFNIVVKRGSMKVGDIVYYIPIDSVLPQDLEELIFPPTGKVKLSNSRVRQIRLRKFPSEGLLVEADTIHSFMVAQRALRPQITSNAMLEQDTSHILGIKKFEPPAPKETISGKPITSKKRLAEHPQFHKYNGLDALKWGNPFTEDEQVSIQLKMHGTNARFGKLATKPKNLFQRILNLLKLLPEYETRYGSNNVDITLKNGASGFYDTDVYGTAFKACNADTKVKENEMIFGEIVGEGIQKNYHYGHKTPHFVLFDVKVFTDKNDLKGRWLTPSEVEIYAKERGFEMVPVLYKGFYDKATMESLISGVDPYYPPHKIREGIVIKSESNYNDPMSSAGKKARKVISPEYLDDKSNTDLH